MIDVSTSSPCIASVWPSSSSDRLTAKMSTTRTRAPAVITVARASWCGSCPCAVSRMNSLKPVASHESRRSLSVRWRVFFLTDALPMNPRSPDGSVWTQLRGPQVRGPFPHRSLGVLGFGLRRVDPRVVRRRLAKRSGNNPEAAGWLLHRGLARCRRADWRGGHTAGD